jgi:hypothetical protein
VTRSASPLILTRVQLCRLLLLGWLSIATSPLVAAPSVRVGKARFDILRTKDAPRRFIHIHGNEITARQVLREHLGRDGAGAALMVRGGTRNVKIEKLWIDPNRMFSSVGATANLRRLNPNASDDAIQKVLRRLDRDLPALLHAVLPPSGALLLSMHNNSQGYSIQTEIPISEKHHLPVPSEPNNFFLVTDPEDYRIFEAGPYNAVLQSNPPDPDDGSLSRLCASRRIRYVNLEAKLGEYDRQLEMLAWADKALPQVRS